MCMGAHDWSLWVFRPEVDAGCLPRSPPDVQHELTLTLADYSDQELTL